MSAEDSIPRSDLEAQLRFERLLVDRAVEELKQRGVGKLAVNAEDIAACIDPRLLDDVRAAVGVPVNGERGNRRLSA